MIRIGIVGVGGYGWTLVRAIEKASDTAGCRLVAAADMQFADLPERRAVLREEGVRLFDDALEMYRAMQGQMDIVYIATGIASHRLLTVEAARAGYHVHLEKPPAGTVQEVDEMLQALRDSGRMCLVGFQAVHGRDIYGVKQRIAEGRLGRVRRLACHACWPRTARYYQRNDWAGRLRSGRAWVLDGPAVNALAHQINNMLFWASPEAHGFADPTAVRAELYTTGDLESHNTAAIEIHTASGATACFLASHATRRNDGPVIRVEAEKATVLWRMRHEATITYADGTTERFPHDPTQHVNMVTNLVEAVRQGRPETLVDPLAASRKVVLALNGAHESSRQVHRIDDSHVTVEAPGTPHERMVVAGLDELLVRAAEGYRLLSDLPDAPAWTVATEPFDLTGYDRFPQRFHPDATEASV